MINRSQEHDTHSLECVTLPVLAPKIDFICLATAAAPTPRAETARALGTGVPLMLALA